MSPLIFLAMVIGLLAAAWVAYPRWLERRRRRLQLLAGEWGMQFCAEDRFGLTRRVVENFPVCGAVDVRVVDLIYCSEGNCHRYIFTAEYTEGVVRTKRRVRRAGMVVESRGQEIAGSGLPVALARRSCRSWSSIAAFARRGESDKSAKKENDER